MKNKSYLLILELLCMVLFFSLIVALTLRGFSCAQDNSYRKSILESAIIVTQNTAEILKSTGGDFAYTAEKMFGASEEGSLIIHCDKNSQPLSGVTSEKHFSIVAVQIEMENPLLDGAHISAVYEDEIIFEFDVCWQRRAQYGS